MSAAAISPSVGAHMSAAGPSQDANCSPSGGSAAATAASVGVVISAAGPLPRRSLPLGGTARSAKGVQ